MIKLKRGAKILVNQCGRLKKGERVLVICDKNTKAVGEILIPEIKKTAGNFKLMIDDSLKAHGNEPASAVAKEMLKADLIFCLTKHSLAHSRARLKATEAGARYLSLPDYSLNQLASDALAVDYKKIDKKNRRLKNIIGGAENFKITAKKGTEIFLEAGGRPVNYCPGFCAKAGELNSPPDIEINVAPVEAKSHGVIVVDGSIPYPGLGVIKKSVRVEIADGAIKKIKAADSAQNRALNNLFGRRAKPERKILAEFGIGLNPRAKLSGLMLEDEGSLGTAHFGFGSNFSIGGTNRADLHIDFVILGPDIYADGKLIMKSGNLII